MDAILDHWALITFVVTMLISIINAITKHFSEHKGLVKVLLFVVEILSLFTSYGQLNGKFGKLKAPLTSVKSDE